MRVVRLGATFAVFFAITVSVAAPQTSGLPAQLSDAEFWRVFTEFSEPSGNYPYENFVTNEETIQDVMPVLTKVAKPGGVYLGVGPEQNFTYISGLKPGMAFIFDIRRQNAIEHLMYKAIFEMSPTRWDFVSRLFSIKSPDRVPDTARANGLFLAFDGIKGDKAYYTANLAAIKDNLAKHKFALSAEDLQKVEYIYDVFFRAGPDIDYTFASAFPQGMAPAPNYMQAMIDTDANKKAWSFLATEENYRIVRNMQMKNLIIPLVGDFAGPKAIRKVGEYLGQHKATVSAFYVSNVEAYLGGTAGAVSRSMGGPEKIRAFYENAATLPVDSSSMYVRFIGANYSTYLFWWKGAWLQSVAPMMDVRNKLRTNPGLTYEEALRLVPDPSTLLR